MPLLYFYIQMEAGVDEIENSMLFNEQWSIDTGKS